LKELPEHLRFWDRAPIWFSGPEGKDHPSRLKALEIIGRTSKILEIGCGNGVDFDEMLRRNLFSDFYCGVDVCETYIDYLTQKYPKSNKYEFMHARNGLVDASARFSDKYFEVSYARAVLEHNSDFCQVIDTMLRLARRVVVTFFIPPRDPEVMKTIMIDGALVYNNRYSKDRFEDYVGQRATFRVHGVPLDSVHPVDDLNSHRLHVIYEITTA
jgi:ubiquinone/menaquinone biosynthesis C-methylase UbiE